MPPPATGQFMSETVLAQDCTMVAKPVEKDTPKDTRKPSTQLPRLYKRLLISTDTLLCRVLRTRTINNGSLSQPLPLREEEVIRLLTDIAERRWVPVEPQLTE